MRIVMKHIVALPGGRELSAHGVALLFWLRGLVPIMRRNIQRENVNTWRQPGYRQYVAAFYRRLAASAMVTAAMAAYEIPMAVASGVAYN